MPNDECSDLKREAHEAGDLHYRTMTQYIRGEADVPRRRVLGVAVAYRRALQWLIDCYRRVRNGSASRQQAETAEKYKDLVEKDIEMLEDPT